MNPGQDSNYHAETHLSYIVGSRGASQLGGTFEGTLQGRDTGNDFYVPQISGGSVSIPGTLNVG